MRFELVYSHGGHGGPYLYLWEALRAAKAIAVGLPHSNHVDIYLRDVKGFVPENLKMRVRYRDTDETVFVYYHSPQTGFREIFSYSIDKAAGFGYTLEVADISEYAGC